jgi:FkbM family methyltransferase
MFIWQSDILPQTVWQAVLSSDRPLLVYGMGNGADKLAQRLALYGREVDDYFASDGFVRGQCFRGKKELSKSEALSRYVDPIVLLAFASNRSDVLSMLYAFNGECDLYMPDLPVSGENYFDGAFFERHRKEIAEAASLFADERSREILDATIRYKLSGRISYLRMTGDGAWDMRELLSPARYRRTLDGGAYSGDTAQDLLRLAPHLREIVAIEPDRRNFRRLSRFAEEEQRVTPINAALLNSVGEIEFSVSGNRNATLGVGSHGAKRELVPTLTVDSLPGTFDFIKLDVEGAEKEALLGAKETILRDRPELLVSLYHRSEDLFVLPLLLHELCDQYDFYLRRNECLPAWELHLLAIPCEKGECP